MGLMLHWSLPRSRIVWLDIENVLSRMCPRKNRIYEDKVAGCVAHFEGGGEMSPSEIESIKDGVIIVEGRHRLVAALQLGETHAPFTTRQ